MIGTISSLRGPSYPIPYSLRFRSSASAYLSKTFVLGNRKTWTWSGWVKLGAGAGTSIRTLFSPTRTGASDTAEGYIYFAFDNTLTITGQTTTFLKTSRVFRDPSAWYHIVVAMDTTTVAADRLRVYVNGERATTSTYNALALNADYAWNQAVVHEIGRGTSVNPSWIFDGYLTEVHFVDGQALTPAAFGNISSATGVWAPKKYTGTYGTNGFYLKFADNSAATAAAIGKDSSGKAVPNNWTPTNISMVAGSTYDSMTDTPTPYGDTTYYSGWNPSYGLQFRSSASTYLSRSPSAVGNRQTWTWSGWVKRGTLGVNNRFLGAGTTAADYDVCFFDPNNALSLTIASGNVNRIIATTSSVFGDTSAWYHVVYSIDTTQAVGTNAIKIYVNGVQQNITVPTYTQNQLCNINSIVSHFIGTSISLQYFDGYLTEVNFIDGQALTPVAFGETVDGRWVPKTYTGAYGTNGFYLNFADGSAMTAVAIGNDASSNSNNWTPTNLAIADAIDYGAKTARGNYCTWNPLNSTLLNAATDGNLRMDVANTRSCLANMAMSSGKWYAEIAMQIVTAIVGIVDASYAFVTTGAFGQTKSYGYISTGNKQSADVISAYGTSWAAGDIIGIAYDADAGSLTFYKNNVSQGVAFTGINVPVVFAAYGGTGTAAGTFAYLNAGQRPFTYTPPAGFKALCTHNLPAPTIRKAAAYMAATTYTGTGVGRTISNTVNNTSFQPDLVWIKGRSGATDHALYDSVRGATKDLASNSTAAETTQTNGLTAFGANGFDIGALAKLNTSAATYVAWQWKEDAAAGFDIVSYTGTGANTTIAHNLGVAPAMVIVKSQTGGTGNWQVRHTSIAAANSIQLNSTAAAAAAATVWNSTAPTSSVFNIGTSTDVNASGVGYVAYCFAEIAGYSKFGSYIANGSADGPFVYLGFKPKWVMIKNASAAELSRPWVIIDTSRDNFNLADNDLSAQTSAVEITSSTVIDILSNGFKLRGTSENLNAGNVHIFAAFAEVPSKYALAR